MDYVKISEIMFAYKNHPNIVDPNIKSEYSKLLKCTKEYNSKVFKEAEKVKKGKSKNQNVSVELLKKREEEEKTRL
jgi:beta-galactosidase GanA